MRTPSLTCFAPRLQGKQLTPYYGRADHAAHPTCATSERDITLSHTASGVTVGAWLIEPSGDAVPSGGRGVVLLTDIYGHQDEGTRAYAHALASAGLPTLVPDLYRGCPWDRSRPKSELEGWRELHTYARASEDVRAAVSTLRDLGVTRVGLLGFCFGGGRTMYELGAERDMVCVGAAVVFYPTHFDARATSRAARCPLMAVFAEKDELAPQKVVDELKDGLKENTVMRECEILVYPDADHEFAHHPTSEDDRDDCEALKSQTVTWFMEHL